jgi:hypothetical protein
MAERELSLDVGSYRQAYGEQVEQAMGEGYSLTAFAGLIGVSRRAVDGWIASHPAFAEAVARGQARRLAHWERAALDVVERGGAGSASVILFGLKSMGAQDWADDDEGETSDDRQGSVVIFALPENGRT